MYTLLVARAVERPHRRLALAAGSRPAAAEQHQLGRPVGAARGAEDVVPDDLGAAQHAGNELRLRVVGRRLGQGPAARSAARRPPPPARPRIVSGLMPKTQPAINATATVPMPMLRPPTPKPPPPPRMPRTSSTFELSSWPSIRIEVLLAGSVLAGTRGRTLGPPQATVCRRRPRHPGSGVSRGRREPGGNDRQVFGSVTPCWPWYLPPRSL